MVEALLTFIEDETKLIRRARLDLGGVGHADRPVADGLRVGRRRRPAPLALRDGAVFEELALDHGEVDAAPDRDQLEAAGPGGGDLLAGELPLVPHLETGVAHHGQAGEGLGEREREDFVVGWILRQGPFVFEGEYIRAN